jgi:hypothetical protein
MRSRISVGLTRRPSIATIRSPGRRPISAAGRPDCTWSTAPVTGPPAIPERIAKRTTASARFVPGPAAITVTFRQVRCRQ